MKLHEKVAQAIASGSEAIICGVRYEVIAAQDAARAAGDMDTVNACAEYRRRINDALNALYKAARDKAAKVIPMHKPDALEMAKCYNIARHIKYHGTHSSYRF